MRSVLKLYILFFVMLSGQFFMKRYFVSFPDITLLLVITAGVFFSPRTALLLALATAFARNSLLVSTLKIDLLLFPMAALMPLLFGKLLKRNNPFAGMMISLFAFLLVASGEILYMNSVFSSGIPVAYTLIRNIPSAFLTVMFYPVIMFVTGMIARESGRGKTIGYFSVIR